MLRGLDLWRESCPSWEEGGSFLLLNPRLSETWRERVLGAEFPDLEDHVWLGTSGTSGNLKMVALSRTALEASARAVNGHLGVTSRDVWLNPLPLFHVGGLGIAVRAAVSGARVEMLGAWNPADYAARAHAAGATFSSLVPTQVHDLVAARLSPPPALRAVVVGGASLDAYLRGEAVALGWPLLPSYGLTEAASQVATARMGQVEAEWLPVLEHVEVRTGGADVLELRGPSSLTGWMIFGAGGVVRWEDPKRDGWYATSDRGELRGRELRVLGRMDDLVKIRGELVDIAALERALQARVRAGLVVVRSESDERNGQTLQVVAENGAAAEEARLARDDVFPAFARPETIMVDEIVRTALGKTMRW
jgi:o-succinylbenzoate---CoA ligase